MVNPCPNGFCLTWHFDDPYDGTRGATHPICYYRRPVYEVRPLPNGTSFEFFTGEHEWGWQSGYVDRVTVGESYATLAKCRQAFQDWGGSNDYFTIDPNTRNRCFSSSAPPPPPLPSLILRGVASPPPPPPRNMCCDCNTIATIFAEQANQLIAEKQKQLEAIRDHIDMRAVEQLQQINKMLQDMEINADLQPIIDEIKRAEANLWNGISGG